MAAFIILMVKISVAMSVFALGLTATVDDVTYLFRTPGKFLRALLSMAVIMPAVAVILVLSFDLRPAVKIALTALSVSPTPPLLPKKAMKAGGTENYAVGLLVAASLLAIIWIPLSLEIFQRIFGIPLEMRALPVAGLVLTSVLAPLAAGMALRAAAPEFARRIAKSCATVATVLLILAVLPALVGILGPMRSLVGDGTLAALAAFSLIGLIAGHVLGGPAPEDRKVLAHYTIARHPGIAIAIAQANFPQERRALAAIILAMLVSAILWLPYQFWTKAHPTTTATAK